MAILTLSAYVVTDRLYQYDTGPEAHVGDQVKLYLDQDSVPAFPEYIVGIIQHPITRVLCGTATSYEIDYDSADLDGAADALVPDNVVSAEIVSAVDILQGQLEDEVDAREAADAALLVQITAGGVAYDPAIIGLDGGGSTKLDGVTVVAADLGKVRLVIVSNIAYFYVVATGLVTQSVPTRILPETYHGTSNAYYWKLTGLRPITSADITDASSGGNDTLDYSKAALFESNYLKFVFSGYQTSLGQIEDGESKTYYFMGPSGTGVATCPTDEYVDDAAAATAGLPVGALYFDGTYFRARMS
jgi:hypothetical protein